MRDNCMPDMSALEFKTTQHGRAAAKGGEAWPGARLLSLRVPHAPANQRAITGRDHSVLGWPSSVTCTSIVRCAFASQTPKHVYNCPQWPDPCTMREPNASRQASAKPFPPDALLNARPG